MLLENSFYGYKFFFNRDFDFEMKWENYELSKLYET
jgi:hypothetical protein